MAFDIKSARFVEDIEKEKLKPKVQIPQQQIPQQGTVQTLAREAQAPLQAPFKAPFEALQKPIESSLAPATKPLGEVTGFKTAQKLGETVSEDVGEIVGGRLGSALEEIGKQTLTPSGIQESLAFEGALLAGGAAIGGAAQFLGVGKFTRVGKRQALERIQTSLHDVHSKEVSKFGESLELAVRSDPERKVPLREIIDTLNLDDAAKILDPKVKQAINGIPLLKKIFKNPNLADTLNAIDVNDITNFIGTRLPQVGKRSLKPTEIALSQLKNEIKGAAGEAFPEIIGKANARYAKFINPWKVANKEMKARSVINNISQNFQNPQIEKLVRDALPREALRDMDGIGNAARSFKLLKWIGQGTAVVIGYEMLRRTLRPQGGQ